MIKVNKELYEYIYNEMNAKYCPDYKEVMINIDNEYKENLRYLGTYFPRSFKEAYVIYNNIFSNDNIYQSFLKKDTINILDIGSGTGGNLLGLLQVICKVFKNKNINIYSIDGNENALDIQKKLIRNCKKFINLNGNKISCTLYTRKFTDKDDIKSKIENILDYESVDIIQSFKFLNELYNVNFSKNQGAYESMLDIGSNYLNDNGLLCLIDITNKVGKVEDQEFMSIIINEECKKYLKNTNSELKYIIPTCCAFNYNNCVSNNKCFSKYKIDINYIDWKDISKISYKLFIKNPLGESVLDDIHKNFCNKMICHCLNTYVDENCTKSKDEPYFL